MGKIILSNIKPNHQNACCFKDYHVNWTQAQWLYEGSKKQGNVDILCINILVNINDKFWTTFVRNPVLDEEMKNKIFQDDLLKGVAI